MFQPQLQHSAHLKTKFERFTFFLAKLTLRLDMKTNKCLKDKKFRVWVAGIFFSKGQKPKREAYSAPSMYLTVNTVCSRSLDLFYIASYYIKLVKTSLTTRKTIQLILLYCLTVSTWLYTTNLVLRARSSSINCLFTYLCALHVESVVGHGAAGSIPRK